MNETRQRKTPEQFIKDYGGPASKLQPIDHSPEAMLKLAKEWQAFADEQLKDLRESLK